MDFYHLDNGLLSCNIVMDFDYVYSLWKSKYSPYTHLIHGFGSQSSYSLCNHGVKLNPLISRKTTLNPWISVKAWFFFMDWM